MSLIKMLGGILGTLLMVAGCFHAEDASIDSQCGALAETFFRKPPKVQIAEFSTYQLEKQYVIFICGNQAIHPPALYLARPFAQEGMKAVDFLKEKLNTTQGDLTTRDIVLLFAKMDALKTYDVAGDQELVKLLTDNVSKMKSDWKEVTEESLKEIVSKERPPR